MTDLALSPERHDWMRGDDLRRLFDVLGGADKARLVGGCVRNALLGEPVADIDIATRHEPKDVLKRLEAAGIKSIPTGIDHGTVTAVMSGVPYEITTLRKDVETDGRRAVVAFTDKWEEDAERRDFTVNALYADLDGNIFDPFGGLSDIDTRTIRFIGDAGQRIREDYLRILRFFRFQAWYGRAPIHKGSLQACADLKNGLASLSVERVWSEIKKLLTAADPGPAAMAMLETGILDKVLPESSNVEGLQALIRLEGNTDLKPDALLRLMAMSGRDELAMARLSKRLKLSKKERKRLAAWAASSGTLKTDLRDQDIRAMAWHDGQRAIGDRLILRAAGARTAKDRKIFLGWADMIAHWAPPEFPLSGTDIIKAGVEKGPDVARMQKALEALWLRSDFKAGAAQLTLALGMLLARQ